MSKQVMEQSELKISEVKEILRHIINNNNELTKNNIVPIAFNIIGDAGLGKTSLIKQIGKEFKYKNENIVLLNLSQLDEVGDLIGLPCEEYQMVITSPEGQKGLWVKEKAIPSYTKLGYEITNKSRMNYSEPAWISGKTGPGILILDDFSRCQPRFVQATMELILTQSFMNWKLPENWTIVLSSNPDDGNYSVAEIDPAQQSRYMNCILKFDVEEWAEWAEKSEMDSRGINFLLLHKEIVSKKNLRINPRSISLFLNSIKSIKDFEKELPLIQNLGEGSLGTEATTMFTTFISNNLDKLISPVTILNPEVSFDTIEREIKNVVKSNKDYRADIAHVLTLRILNHLQFNMNEEDITTPIVERVGNLLKSDVLGSDLKFVLGKRILRMNKKFQPLLMSDEMLSVILD